MQYGVRDDFFTSYLAYTGGGETPTFYNRWAAITAIGALIGKSAFLKLGHKKIYPNVYCMLIGSAGARKGTAIKTMKKLILSSGYSTVSASKVTKEKFLMDLAGVDTLEGADLSKDDILDANLFGSDEDKVAETFIISDEFNDFFGNNILEFISLLGALWDWEGPYENRVKNSKSYIINNPCISIIGGNTPTGFSLAFPPEIIGQGFFSRLIMVFSEPTGRRIAFPAEPCMEDTANLVAILQRIRLQTQGEFQISGGAKNLLEKIYSDQVFDTLDIRFESYLNRRFDHLLKLCMIHAASRLSMEITDADVRYANSVLTYTEHLMPRALGEFGKSKNADVANKVVQIIENRGGIVTQKEIWKLVNNDLEKIQDLGYILQNLVSAEKIQKVTGDIGFLPLKKVAKKMSREIVDYGFLSQDEQEKVE